MECACSALITTTLIKKEYAAASSPSVKHSTLKSEFARPAIKATQLKTVLALLPI